MRRGEGSFARPARMTSDDENRYGVLVGWSTQDLGSRLILRVQTVNKPPPHRADDISSHFYLMTKNQAVQLGNNLFQASGQTSPGTKKKRSWLDRILGS